MCSSYKNKVSLNEVERSCGFWDFDLIVKRYICIVHSISTYPIVCTMMLFYSNSASRGGWSREGVEFIEEHSSDVLTVCNSYHLTSFAVLVSAKHEPEQVTKHYTILWHAKSIYFYYSLKKLKH